MTIAKRGYHHQVRARALQAAHDIFECYNPPQSYNDKHRFDSSAEFPV